MRSVCATLLNSPGQGLAVALLLPSWPGRWPAVWAETPTARATGLLRRERARRPEYRGDTGVMRSAGDRLTTSDDLWRCAKKIWRPDRNQTY